MKIQLLTIILFVPFILIAQTHSPCSYNSILRRNLVHNPNAALEYEQNEVFIQKILSQRRSKTDSAVTYIIPIVLHIFHDGEEGKIDMEQVQSGLKILNDDFKGLNEGWNTIDPRFDSIKGTLNIEFCLATIDPEGIPTTGVNYYDNRSAMLNENEFLLTFRRWDNYKYLNIYLPKYVFREPSNFTAYAYFPNTTNSDRGRDGVFYSSIRWGYGNQSELEPGQDWASVISHELGHWLNLYHTFENGCTGLGDFVDDTPPSLGGTIELSGCKNNDLSCGVPTNGENFMDYNHDCKKMFTKGQIERMEAALFHPARITLWSESNLQATGCIPISTSTNETNLTQEILVFPNPSFHLINFTLPENSSTLTIFNLHGQLIASYPVYAANLQISVRDFAKGLYIYKVKANQQIISGRFIVK